MGKKTFRITDAILAVITVVFVVEAAAPAAAIGPSQYFWWILLIIAFLLPYGIIVSELGTAYDDEGGLYDWVKRAFGNKWGSRVSFYYWVHFPFWIASLAILVPVTLNAILPTPLEIFPSLVIMLAFIWIATFLTFTKISDATWVINLTAVLKVAIALALFGLGIWFAIQHGFADQAQSIKDYFPDFTNTQSLTYLSIILFNFMGFEIITTFAGDMKNPEREIPKAIIVGGIAIAGIYLISSFGIGAAIPSAELSVDSGILEAVSIMTQGLGGWILVAVAIVFLVILFGNIVSWSYGVNYVASYAAKEHNMPKPFGIISKKNRMPIGASMINAIIATIIVILVAFLDPDQLTGGEGKFFWIFFSMNIVFLLMSYIPMFPAFLKLRKIDPHIKRTFIVPGKGIVLQIIAYLPATLLILAIVATIVPLDGAKTEMSKLPVLIATLVFLAIGEIVRIVVGRNRHKEPSVGQDVEDLSQGSIEVVEEDIIASQD